MYHFKQIGNPIQNDPNYRMVSTRMVTTIKRYSHVIADIPFIDPSSITYIDDKTNAVKMFLHPSKYENCEVFETIYPVSHKRYIDNMITDPNTLEYHLTLNSSELNVQAFLDINQLIYATVEPTNCNIECYIIFENTHHRLNSIGNNNLPTSLYAELNKLPSVLSSHKVLVDIDTKQAIFCYTNNLCLIGEVVYTRTPSQMKNKHIENFIFV